MKRILEIKKAIGKLEKTAENPFYKSKYVDINTLLDVISPELESKGLLLLQPLTQIDGRPALWTKIMDVESNKTILEDFITLPDLQDPQKMGSAITYYRRYSIISMFSLQAEDDDANNTKPKSVTKANF